LFYSTGRIYKTTLDNPTGFVAMTGINNSIVVPSDYEGHKVNINRVSVRCGDVVFFASNVDKRKDQFMFEYKDKTDGFLADLAKNIMEY
jgi:hypothetical protein